MHDPAPPSAENTSHKSSIAPFLQGIAVHRGRDALSNSAFPLGHVGRAITDKLPSIRHSATQGGIATIVWSIGMG